MEVANSYRKLTVKYLQELKQCYAYFVLQVKLFTYNLDIVGK